MATEANKLPDWMRELYGDNIISVYSRQDAINDGARVDMTEWASRREIMGGFLPVDYNMRTWRREDTPVDFSRALWNAVDIEKPCPGDNCDNGKTTIHPDGGACPVCKGKGKVKGRGVWQDTRGRAHDVIFMGKIAAMQMLGRGMTTGIFKVYLSKDGTTNGNQIKLKLVIDGDGVWIGYPHED